jgi:hypothetical protein
LLFLWKIMRCLKKEAHVFHLKWFDWMEEVE